MVSLRYAERLNYKRIQIQKTSRCGKSIKINDVLHFLQNS
jgi:hypothetical protein